MPKFDPKFSLGNVITLIGMAIGGFMVFAEMRSADAVTNQRLTSLERVAVRAESDREIIIEIRADLKALRTELKRSQ